MQMFLTILVLGCAVATVHGKVFSRCELATTLVKTGLSTRALINDWVCLVESESSRNTAAVGAPNSNGSQDFGLFQINDKYWCKHGVRGNDCNLECSELLTDDITAAVTCSKKIYARHGFTAWHGWTRKCDGQALVDVSYCFA